ncbi:G-PROTEIN COUPLED RECEPTOR [Salix viminalis]|uniref:G-PROTEIN COUPLED RECEPTOR n=1 Tax=Salix viminalis TaxID=40686 RepID=A0A9Q0NZD4_SALVM|nr:G-PROTEIN COUPLED RECEPTOR [Salix viminalis]
MMQSQRDLLVESAPCSCIVIIVTVVVAQVLVGVSSVAVPSSNCYALDNSSRIVDFSSWIGHFFEYEGKDTDVVIRFCKDVETRSQTGYVDFGQFNNFNHFVAGSGGVDFVQGYYNGDLLNCEQSYDKLGRTAQVNIICGSCSNGQCKGELGCICNVTQESSCSSHYEIQEVNTKTVFVELAIPCEKPGPRAFEGFTVGFHPRSWEIVYNGMTQLGYEKSHHEFSFATEQTQVTLYMTAIASLSTLVRKPMIQILPEKGLKVTLSGSGATGSPPTTLTPTLLNVEWTCQEARDTPYEVNVTIPIEGYEPVQFFLTKICEHRQDQRGDSTRGWAIFGIISCIFIVTSTLFCVGGFIYKTRMERLHGIDALPGMTYLTACLETASGVGNGYSRPEENASGYASEASWEQPSATAQGTRKQSTRNYGSI